MWKEIAYDSPDSWTDQIADAARRWAEHRSRHVQFHFPRKQISELASVLVDLSH